MLFKAHILDILKYLKKYLYNSIKIVKKSNNGVHFI